MLGGPFGAVLLWRPCPFDGDRDGDRDDDRDGDHVLGTPSAK